MLNFCCVIYLNFSLLLLLFALGSVHHRQNDLSSLAFDTLTKQRNQLFFDRYLSETAEITKDTAEMEGSLMGLNYSSAHTSSVIWQDERILSLANHLYEFSGAAHPNHGLLLSSFDLVHEKELRITDIFKPNFEKILNTALEEKARQQLEIPPATALEDFLMVSEMHYSNNFCITPKGILFSYQPYEIAAYAFGNLTFFIPFSHVKEVVQDDWLKE